MSRLTTIFSSRRYSDILASSILQVVYFWRYRELCILRDFQNRDMVEVDHRTGNSVQALDSEVARPLPNGRCRVPLDKREGSVKGKVVLCSAEAPLALPEKVEDQGSGNLTLNHLSVEDRSTNHRFGPHIDHHSSMRTSRPPSRTHV